MIEPANEYRSANEQLQVLGVVDTKSSQIIESSSKCQCPRHH